MSSIAWKEVNWQLVDSRIFRYQNRIFKASRDNNIPKVRCLQKRLINSLDAKLVAVRRVTTLNKGKKTPGVDKQVFVTDLQKGKLVKRLRLGGKPIWRVWIDKLGKSEIPTVEDRAKQDLCKLALEPEWEARFEANSYGFRPTCNCHDAIEVINLSLQNNTGDKGHHKYVLDANITKCFDQIDHDYIVKKLGTLPEIERQVNAWLKAGILEEFLDERTEINILDNIIDTPQVEIISPLLFNIALHGIENHMKKWICTRASFERTKDAKRKSLALMRSTDDLVLIHKEETIIRQAKEEMAKWLWDGPRLKLSEEKTSIHNTSNGFDVLGFSFITIARGNILRTKIYPSRKSQGLFLLKVRNIIQNNLSTSAYNLINLLYPIMIGWADYFKYSECSDVNPKLLYLIYQKLRAWAFRRDTRNGRKVVKERYFPSGKSYTFRGTRYYNNWILNGKQLGKDGTYRNNWLPHMIWVKSEKWVKINRIKSPFDGDNLY